MKVNCCRWIRVRRGGKGGLSQGGFGSSGFGMVEIVKKMPWLFFIFFFTKQNKKVLN